jgi:hypothetical protein
MDDAADFRAVVRGLARAEVDTNEGHDLFS